MSARPRRLATCLTVALTVIGCATQVRSQNRNDAGEVLRDSLGAPVWRVGYRVNPTSYASLDTPAATEISARYAYWDSEGLNSPFQGDGGDRFHIAASGYGVQSGKNIFSGAAYFSTGTLRNTRWTDVWDVWMLYPYLIGDSQGGDYIDETYHLSGSYSHFLGRHTLGLRVAYTGRMAHRSRDPRPKNTVSDLSFNPGWSVRLNGGHTLGVFAKYTYYKQHVGISVEEVNRSYVFYLMRGMGLFDRMFSKGESSLSRYYFSDAISGGLQWEKTGRHAFEAVAAVSYRNLHAEESDNRIPYITDRLWVELHGAYRLSMGKNALTIALKGEAGQQKGWERTYERVTADTQTSVQVWRLLSKAMRDKITYATGNLRAEYLQRLCGKWSLRYGLSAAYRSAEESFSNPQYRMQVGDIRPGADFGFRRQGPKGHSMEVRIAVEHKANTNASLVAATDDENEIVVREMLLPLYEYMKKDYTSFGGQAVYTVPVKGFDLRIEAEGGYASGSGHAKKWGASLGLAVAL